MNRIRNIAVGLPVRDGHVLALLGSDHVRGIEFHRAIGGDAHAARQAGVPVDRVKIGLFVGVALCAWVVGMITMARTGSVQANLGVGLEFEYIIAAVIGAKKGFFRACFDFFLVLKLCYI